MSSNTAHKINTIRKAKVSINVELLCVIEVFYKCDCTLLAS